MAASICTDPVAASPPRPAQTDPGETGHGTAPRREYPDAVRVGVGVVVWRGDRVLLVRRGRPPRLGEWGLPGGGQEVGETLFEAAVREVREETGVTIEPLQILTAVDGITRDEEGRVRFHYTLIEVAAEWRAGEPRPSDDVTDVRWAGLEEVEELVAWDETRRIIELAARSRPSAAPRLKSRPSIGRLMRSPLGSLIARPWFDDVTLRLLRDWVFPMWRSWAAAQEAGGDVERFCRSLGIDPAELGRANRLAGTLTEVERAKARAVAADREWERLLFGAPLADARDAIAAEEERLDAAHALTVTALRFAVFARARRIPACRWAIPSPAEVEARHGARLTDPGRAYLLPESLPAVEESRRLASDSGQEYWLRFPSPYPDIGSPCWARVFEPAGVADPPTVIYLHGICIEADHIRSPLREVETLLREGVRVVAPEAPWHGRRRMPGRYGGEPLVATAPGAALDHFAAHVRELGVLTAWARRTSGGPVAWGGTSLGALTTQLAAVHARNWPQASRPDAILLCTTSEGIEDIAANGAFARAFGLDRALHRHGWTAAALRRWRPLTDPIDVPACGAGNVFMVLGRADTVTPFRHGLDIARRWGVPEGQLVVRPQGHFSVPAGLMADDAPVIAFARHLKAL